MSKYKIGDIVRCIDVGIYTSRLDRVHGGGWKKGKEFRIERITNQNGREEGNSLNMPIYWDDCYGVYEHALEPIWQKKIKVYGICEFVNKYYK
jgi:hypothetical protein